MSSNRPRNDRSADGRPGTGSRTRAGRPFGAGIESIIGGQWDSSQYYTPTIRVPQPDGSLLVKPGRPVPLEDYIGVAEIGELFGMSKRWAQAQCEVGRFRSAWKPGGHIKSQWRVARRKVLAARGIMRPDE